MDQLHNHCSQHNNKLHFLLFPLMSQSHIIPLTHFAIALANFPAVHRVSIVTTPLNALRQQPSIDAAGNPKIHLIPIPFPCRDVGLPEGSESTDTLTSLESHAKLFQACDLLQSPIEDLIRHHLQPKPSCIVSTNAVAWIASRITENLNIPLYLFETISCFTVFCGPKIRVLKEKAVSDSEKFRVPDLPHVFELTKAQLPDQTPNGESDDYMTYVKSQIGQARDSSRGLLVNTFHELEPWYADALQKESTARVWCIGPVSQSNSDGREISIPAEHHRCLDWLDTKEPNSVIYACFGSLCYLSPQQVKQIGTGLEKSNRPFIWIIRGQNCSREVEDWLEAEKFEEKVEGRGVVVRGWAPQVQILRHVAVGGFLTHCGWNSTLEGVCAGVPMLTWPMFAEQFYNQAFVVDVLGIGVRIGVERIGEFVEWERVRKGIDELMMEESDEGRRRMETTLRKKKAEEFARMAKGALEEGGSSFQNFTLFIQDVLQHQIS